VEAEIQELGVSSASTLKREDRERSGIRGDALITKGQFQQKWITKKGRVRDEEKGAEARQLSKRTGTAKRHRRKYSQGRVVYKVPEVPRLPRRGKKDKGKKTFPQQVPQEAPTNGTRASYQKTYPEKSDIQGISTGPTRCSVGFDGNHFPG